MDPLYLYIAVFFGSCLEGEISVIASSLAAQKGLLNIYAIGIIAFCATLTMDWGLFLAGRFLGDRISKIEKIKNGKNKAGEWIKKNPTLILVFYRYLYGFRIIVLLILGMSKVPIKKFMVFSFLGIAVWTTLFCLVGYYLGEIIQEKILQYESKVPYVVVGVVMAIFLLIGAKSLIKKLLVSKY